MDFESTIRRNNFGDTANAHYWDTVKRTGHSHPEQDLMLAVLKDALLNFRKHLRNPKKSLRRDREWFFSNDQGGLFSFESVCAVLGLDPQRIRKRLRLWEKEAAIRPNADPPQNSDH
jgi:hypothetical protein